MSQMLVKVFEAKVSEANAETGEINVYIPMSTSSIDRDGESISPLAFKKSLPAFKKRPVLIASHDYRDLTNQIGDFSNIRIEEDGLYGKPRYYIGKGNEEADWGFFLASIGMAAYSVGFIPRLWEDYPEGDGIKTPKRTYSEVELLEKIGRASCRERV